MDSKKAAKKRNKSIRKKNKIIYKVFFFVGMICLFFQYLLFTKTSIDLFVVLSIIIVSGFIGLYFDYKKYIFTHKVSGNLSYIFAYSQNVVFYGGLIGLSFLSLNFYLSKGEINNKKYNIIDRYSVQGRKYHRSERKPVFTIIFNNKEKDIKYSHSYFKEMNEFKSISIESQEGFFGFEVIKDKKLNK